MAQPLARDLSPAAEAVQVAALCRQRAEARLTHACELTAFIMAAARAGIRRAHPHLDALAQARLLAAVQFGDEYAARVQQPPTIEGSMSIPAAILPVVRSFQQLNILYFVGGSIASSAYGMPRSTYDVDMVADMRPQHVAPFVAALEGDYYVDRSAILDALVHQSSFNMLHHATGINIDIFASKGRPYDAEQFRRAQATTLPGAIEPVYLASPEDVILNKLAWYELGNQVSDQQWRDVQGMLRVQGQALDYNYLRHWAAILGLSALLDYALRGERPPRPNDEPQQRRLF